MKKEVLTRGPTKFVLASNYNPNKYYGIDYGPTNFTGRAIVIKSNYRYGKFQAFCKDAFTEGNRLVDIDDKCFNGFVEKIHSKDWRIYQFDTFIELMNWVDEENYQLMN